MRPTRNKIFSLIENIFSIFHESPTLIVSLSSRCLWYFHFKLRCVPSKKTKLPIRKLTKSIQLNQIQLFQSSWFQQLILHVIYCSTRVKINRKWTQYSKSSIMRGLTSKHNKKMTASLHLSWLRKMIFANFLKNVS